MTKEYECSLHIVSRRGIIDYLKNILLILCDFHILFYYLLNFPNSAQIYVPIPFFS